MTKRINIPPPRFDIHRYNSLRYLLSWVVAPIKPFLYANLCKINNKRVFVLLFRALNIVLRWPIKIEYDKNLNLFRIKDKKLAVYVRRKQYIMSYSKGIRERFKLLTHHYHLNDIGLKENDLVIDVGANVGEVSLVISKDYNCSTYCIEPEEAEFKCLKFNLDGYKSRFLNSPLWFEEKTIPFYSANELSDSSCFETEDYTHIIEKATSTLSEVIKSLGNRRVKLLKLEAEGAEPEILMGGLDSLHLVDYISADVGPERGLSYETTLVKTTKILNDHGFELIKMGHPRLVCLYRNSSSS